VFDQRRDFVQQTRDSGGRTTVKPGVRGSDPARWLNARKRAMTSPRLVIEVVGTGVDPVTFRFSGGRSAN
jgi:hypothetical protein